MKCPQDPLFVSPPRFEGGPRVRRQAADGMEAFNASGTFAEQDGPSVVIPHVPEGPPHEIDSRAKLDGNFGGRLAF